MKKNGIINCEITGIRSYGIFVECGEYSGLVHISEISEYFINDINDIFNIGDKVSLYVIDIDEKYKRLKLSYKENHQVHKRIRKNLKIIIGFHSLKNKLPIWISKELNNENNK